MRVALTDKFIASVKPTEKQTDYFDTKCKGLVLRVALNGSRTWCAFYTAPDGKRARMTLGRYPQSTLADARRDAVAAMAQVDQGIDPRNVASSGMTVASLAASYLERRVRGRTDRIGWTP